MLLAGVSATECRVAKLAFIEGLILGANPLPRPVSSCSSPYRRIEEGDFLRRSNPVAPNLHGGLQFHLRIVEPKCNIGVAST